MRVHELITLLQDLPSDHIVIMSSDGEGNNYSPLAPDFGVGEYVVETTWSGYISSDEDEAVINAVILYPTN